MRTIPPERKNEAQNGWYVVIGTVISLPLILIGIYLYALYPLILIGTVVLLIGAGVARAYVGVLAYYNRAARLSIVVEDKRIEHKRAEVQIAPLAQNVHWHYQDSSRREVIEGEVVEPPLALPPGIPSFAQLLDSGSIGAGRPLLLGYSQATGEPIAGTWSKLYSVGIGGMTGSGKSWCAAFLLAQSAAAGAKLIVIDPHAGDDESLATRLAGLSAAFLCDVAQSGQQIESALKLASRELAQRTAGGHAAYQVILVADEWTSLLRGKLGDLLTATALDYSEQGRKYGCFAMLIAQAWQIDAAGQVRDRLASHYCLRTRGDQFRYQLGLRGSAPVDSLFLKPGEAYFLSVAGDLEKIVIPQMTAADLARIGGTVKPAFGFRKPTGYIAATKPATAITAQVAGNRPESSQKVAESNPATTASGTATVASAEAVHAAQLYVAGKEPAEIVRELRGITSKEGSRYQVALKEINDLVRQAIELKG